MNKRIFPFYVKKGETTWRNYLNYINWLYGDTKSLQNYLDYFNPNFYILNQTLNAIQSNTFESTETGGSITINQEDFADNLKKLNFRQGIFNPNSKNFIFEDTDIVVAPSQTIFAKERYRGEEIAKNLNHYLIISQPPTGIFLPKSNNNSLSFIYEKNGQLLVGTSLTLTLELSPSRYYIVNSDNRAWKLGGVEWSLDNIGPDGKFSIQNDKGIVWTNSYPIMHDVYFVDDDNYYEDFIFDNDFYTEDDIIDNRAIVRYIIKAQNITQEETATDLWSKLKVSII